MGLVFDGRLTENFKLSSGTWVSVGNLRLALVHALAPVIQDCVIAGENRDFVAALAWLRPAETAALLGRDPSTSLEELARDTRLLAYLSNALARFNAKTGGSSERIERLLLLTTAPIGDEIAEKGYINQRAALRRRADDVARLYVTTPATEVIVAR
jgi:feruloyl-CoA synthase